MVKKTSSTYESIKHFLGFVILLLSNTLKLLLFRPTIGYMNPLYVHLPSTMVYLGNLRLITNAVSR